MADFSRITPRLGTGAALESVEDVGLIAQAGYSHFLDCRAEFDDGELVSKWQASNPTRRLAYLWNGVDDDGQPKPASWFAASLTFALPALAVPHARVYAHCAAGVNRGPSTAAAIMLACGFQPSDAEAVIRAARPQVELAYLADAVSAVSALYW